MKIISVNDLGSTPARVNRSNGNIYINHRIWEQIPINERKFILKHEEGHYILNTKNEFEADNYAFDHYAGTEEFSLKGILHAIGDKLDIKNNPVHQKRYINIVQKLLQYDAKQNNNQIAKQKLIEMNIQKNIDYLPEKTHKLLMSMLIGFLKNKGIVSIQALPENQRVELLKEFMQTQQVLYLLQRTEEQSSSFLGFKKSDKKSGWFGTVVTGAVTAVGAAFGVPPMITAGAAGLVRNLLNKNKSKASITEDQDLIAWNTAKEGGQLSSFKAYLSQYPSGKYANQAKTEIKAIDDKVYQEAQSINSVESYQTYISQNPEGNHISEANTQIATIEKKKKTTMFAGIAAAIVIIVVLVIVLKR